MTAPRRLRLLPLVSTLAMLAVTSLPAAGCCLVPIANHPYKRSEGLRDALRDGRVLLVDVRSPGEYRGGHIPGAINIPHTQIDQSLHRLPRNRDIVLYCKSGSRDSRVRKHLRKLGYRRVYSFCSYKRWKGALVRGGER